jgi:hypothetical protein
MDVEHRLARVELLQKQQVRKWKWVAGAMSVLVIATAGVAIAAISSTTTSVEGIRGDVYSYDETIFTLTSGGMILAALPISAAGTTSGAAVEIAVIPVTASEAVGIGDWYYQVTAAELGIATLTSGTYQATLYIDGVDQGSLFFKQDTSDAAVIETAVLKWDLGTSLSGGSYVVQIVTA